MAELIFFPLGDAAPSMLMAGEFHVTQTGAGLASGFRKMGWDVAEVWQTDPTIRANRIDLKIANRLLGSRMIKSYNEQIILASHLGHKIFLTVKGNYVTRDTLRALKEGGIKTVNYYPDYRFDYDDAFDEDRLEEYDLVVTTKSFQVDYLKRLLGEDRVAFVHHGFVPEVHRRRTPAGETPRYLWDVCFIGNASPNKLAWLEPLARHLAGRSMIVIGHRWPELAAGTALAPHVLGSALAGDHFARAIEHSRINIAVHHGPGGRQGWEDRISTRSFEVPACGGFMLHIDNEEIRSLFEPHREIGLFATPEELIAKVKHYLADDSARQAIADAGHARAVPAYSYHARAVELEAAFHSREETAA